MSKRTYHPGRGDIVHLNFAPSAGREMTQPHYAVVISPKLYNRKAGLCLAVPITSRVVDDPLYVHLPAGALRRDGTIYCDQIRSLDYRERSISYVSPCPPDVFEQVVQRVLELVDPLEDQP